MVSAMSGRAESMRFCVGVWTSVVVVMVQTSVYTPWGIREHGNIRYCMYPGAVYRFSGHALSRTSGFDEKELLDSVRISGFDEKEPSGFDENLWIR